MAELNKYGELPKGAKKIPEGMQRVHLSAFFDQKPPMTGVNVAVSHSNDLVERKDVQTAPMLVYDTYESKATGQKVNSYMASYTRDEFDIIKELANKDGDSMVVDAKLKDNSYKDGKNTIYRGLKIDVDTLATPEIKFDKSAHIDNTLVAREHKETIRANKIAEKQQLANDGPEL